MMSHLVKAIKNQRLNWRSGDADGIRELKRCKNKRWSEELLEALTELIGDVNRSLNFLIHQILGWIPFYVWLTDSPGSQRIKMISPVSIASSSFLALPDLISSSSILPRMISKKKNGNDLHPVVWSLILSDPLLISKQFFFTRLLAPGSVHDLIWKSLSDWMNAVCIRSFIRTRRRYKHLPPQKIRGESKGRSDKLSSSGSSFSSWLNDWLLWLFSLSYSGDCDFMTISCFLRLPGVLDE